MSRKNNFGNTRKKKQVKALSGQILPTKDLIDSFSFNFFFLTEDQSVEESTIAYWEKEGLLSKHLSKLQNYSKRSLKGMMSDKGMRGMFKPLRDKSAQPAKARLHMPSKVPSCGEWYEFHLGGKQRLIGFVMPGEFHGETFPGVDSEFTISKNTFYVIYFDGGHDFWPSKLKHT